MILRKAKMKNTILANRAGEIHGEADIQLK
jgi:hypothetical protein